MAKITLREYVKEIEGLIDRRQIEEAIAHCRHILEAFPKHIDTYRLLGKAFLEMQRYSDASDIFQRVLSAVPDDFVANVGMSIIREDDDDTDAAIWHMERAFERQPYNAAIQAELKRLYGIRDGMEPPKVRLTRGALARMYAKGNLYQQAIAELRTALAEDTDRPDLQVVLADMYARNGQNVESIETCGSILGKLPYCLQANQILATILETTDRQHEADRYRKRLRSLNPYEAHLTPQVHDSNQVPNEAVTVHRLEWTGSLPSSDEKQPDWAKSLDVDLPNEFASDEDLPDWLRTASEGREDTFVQEDGDDEDEVSFRWEDSSSQDVYAAATEEDDSATVPPWMQEAGWEAADEVPGSEDTSDRVITPDLEESEIAPGDMPDWLKDLAPESDEESVPEEEPTELKYDEKGTDWLSDVTEDIKSTEGVTGLLEESELEDDEDLTPDWLKDLSAEAETQFAETEQVEQPEITDSEVEEAVSDTPDWLAEAGAIGAATGALAVGKAEETLESTGEDEIESELPDWLMELETPAEDSLPLEQISVEGGLEPDRMPETEESLGEPIDMGTAEQSMPDWLEQLGSTDKSGVSIQHPQEEEPEDLLPDQEIPDWLKQISAADEIEAVSPASEEIDELEEDLVWDESEDELDFASADELDKNDIGHLVDSLKNETESTEPEADIDLPDWLQEISDEPAESDVVSEISDEDLPEWIQELEGDEPQAEELASMVPSDETESLVPIEEQEEEPALEADLPPWLQDTLAEREAEEAAEVEPAPIEEIESLITDDEDEDLPDWLKEMSAEQDDEVVELISDPPPTTEEAVPSITDDVEVADLEAGLIEETVSSEKSIDMEDPESALAWLEGLAAKQGVDEEELITSPEDRSEQPPEWVMDEQAEADKEEPEEVIGEDLESLQALFDSSDLLAEESEAVDEDEQAAEAELPSWMQEASPSTTESEDEEDVELPSWLQEEMATDEEEDEEALPEWMDEIGTAEAVMEEITEAVEIEPDSELQEPELEEKLPDWLESLGETESSVEIQHVAEEEEVEELPSWAMEAEDVTDESIEAPDKVPTPADEDTLVMSPEEVAAMLEESDDEIEILAEKTVEGTRPEDWIPEVSAEVDEAEPVSETEPQPVDTAALEEPAMVELEEPEEIDEVEAFDEAEVDIFDPPTWVVRGVAPKDEEPDWIPPAVMEEMQKAAERKSEVDLNTISLVELERLPGVGYRAAQTIVNYRDEHGLFGSIEELQNIPDLDPASVEIIASMVSVVSPEVEEPEVASEEETPEIQHIFELPQTGELIDEDYAKIVKAREVIGQGEHQTAMEMYNQVLQKGYYLEKIIADLEKITDTVDDDLDIWQTLGDAYLRVDELDRALDAYNQAERLLL